MNQINTESLFSLSETAQKRISSLLHKRNDPGIKLRISVDGGGCAGFQYRYEFVSDPISSNDFYIEQNGTRVLIDHISLEFIKGSKLEYLEDLNGSYFQIRNPKATSGCGCGNSFGV
ncbi:MAG: iron-sulfur cluster assembly accessory protein [Rickettsiales bacterium]